MSISRNSIGKEWEILRLQQKGFGVLPIAIVIPNDSDRDRSEEET